MQRPSLNDEHGEPGCCNSWFPVPGPERPAPPWLIRQHRRGGATARTWARYPAGSGPVWSCVRPYLAVAPAFLVALGVCSLVYSGAIAASASSANFRCEASSCSAKS